MDMSQKVETANSNDEPMVRLRSSDNEIFTIKKDVAIKAKFIAWHKNLKDPDAIIPVPEVKSSILQIVIEYCEQHVGDDDFNINRDVMKSDPFGDQLRHVNQEVLFDIIKAADYLIVNGLMELGCYIGKDMMKGKSVEEMSNISHIKNDYILEEDHGLSEEDLSDSEEDDDLSEEDLSDSSEDLSKRKHRCSWHD